MDVHVIRFANEWYIQDGFTDLRDHLGNPIENQPKFVKTTLEHIKQLNEKPKLLQLNDDCAFTEIGFTAPRISKDSFGEKKYFYTIQKKEMPNPESETLTDIAKVFADKFRIYAEGTKNNKKGAKHNDRFNTTSD